MRSAVPVAPEAVPILVPLLGAWVGHTALIVYFQNLVYAQPLPQHVLRPVRKINFVLVLAGGPLIWFLLSDWGLSVGECVQALESAIRDPQSAALGQVVPAIYLALCWAVGFVIAPVLAALYWLRRRRPAALVSNDTTTVDVAAELGYPPAGTGKHRRLALLPFNQVFQVDFTEKTFTLPRLPAAWDGLSILHVSDLHLCGTPDRRFYQYVMERCRAWEPDIVAVTGDIVDSDLHHAWVVPTLGRLRWRVAAFAILGNHDSWRDAGLIRRRLRRIGMHVLGNTWEKLELRGETLVAIGHEGPWFRPGPDLKDCPREPFRLCLSHTPDNIAWGRRERIDLMLSGHNHGGQIRFPLIGSVFVPSRYGRRYDCGTFAESPTLLHVSRGLGGKQPLRYNCRPEVTKIILRAGTGSP